MLLTHFSKSKSRLYLFLLCYLFSTVVHAQNDSITLLKSQIQYIIKDENRVLLLNQIAAEYAKTNPDSAYHYAQKAKESSKEGSLELAQSSRELGNYYLYQGNYDMAFSSYLVARKIYEEKEMELELAGVLNKMGDVYRKQKNYNPGLEFYKLSHEIFKKNNNQEGVSTNLNNLGDIFRKLKLYDTAMVYYRRSLAIDDSLNHFDGKAGNWNNMGDVFKKTDLLDSVLIYYQKSLVVCRQLQNNLETTENLSSITDVFIEKENYDSALFYLKDAISTAERYEYLGELKDAYRVASRIYTKLNELDNALLYNEKYIKAKDELYDIQKLNIINSIEQNYKDEKQANLLALERAKNQNATLQKNLILLALFVVIFILIGVYITQQKQKKTNLLLDQKNQALEAANTKIKDSIRYAQTIQRAILYPEEELKNHLKEYFLLYKPRDVVSGDFYWFLPYKDQLFLAVVDCTGHGVPGAFMSMIGNTLLNQIITEHKIFEPDQILQRLHDEVKVHLRQDKELNTDGMDVALCRLQKLNGDEEIQIDFAGAKSSLVYTCCCSNEVKRVKGTNKMIGGKKMKKNRHFEKHTLTLHQNDMVYLMSDGIADQLNQKKEKIGTKQLLSWLNDLYMQPIDHQKEFLESQIHLFKKDSEQTDDITLWGVRL